MCLTHVVCRVVLEVAVQTHTGEIGHGLTHWTKIGYLAFSQQQQCIKHVVHLVGGNEEMKVVRSELSGG